MRTLALGDIHGCLTSLKKVLEVIQLTEEDTLIFLGDYVDRGPDSKGVIDFLKDHPLKDQFVFLTGNHEEKFILSRVYDFEYNAWLDMWDADATLSSYGTRNMNDIPESHWEFLRKCRPYFETDTHIFVHATLEYDIPLDEQQPYTLIHKKFIDPKMPHISEKIVICGHTAQKNHQPLNLGHTICIDTDAGRNGWISCLDVQSGSYWQANELGEHRHGKLYQV